MNGKAKPACGFDDGITKKLVVVVSDEYVLAIVTALDDVLRLAGDDVAGKACNWLSLVGEKMVDSITVNWN